MIIVRCIDGDGAAVGTRCEGASVIIVGRTDKTANGNVVSNITSSRDSNACSIIHVIIGSAVVSGRKSSEFSYGLSRSECAVESKVADATAYLCKKRNTGRDIADDVVVTVQRAAEAGGAGNSITGHIKVGCNLIRARIARRGAS